MRLILCYQKLGAMAFVAHLDFQQLWWRILRLARLDLELTQGYNPRPKMRFALPLATGFQGERELLEIYLARKEDAVTDRLNAVMPPGLMVLAATEVPAAFPKVTALVDALGYSVELPQAPVSLGPLPQKGGEFVLGARLKGARLDLLLKADNQRTIRPDTLVGAWFPQHKPASLAITRTGIYARPDPKISPTPQGLLFLNS